MTRSNFHQLWDAANQKRCPSMRLSRETKESLLARCGMECECTDSSHISHPDRSALCGRPLKVRYYFRPIKAIPLTEDDFEMICSSCHSENRSLRSQRF